MAASSCPCSLRSKSGVVLDASLDAKIRATLRSDYTPRHVPDKIIAVPAIPMTRTGKKMEVPVRRLLMGTPPERAVNHATMSDPAAFDFFIQYAKQQPYQVKSG